MDKIQLSTLLEYRDYLNDLGKRVPQTAYTLTSKLKGDKYKYTLALLLGTELIKEQLKGLIILDDYILQLRAFLEKNGKHIIVSIKNYDSLSHGRMKEVFAEKYFIKEDNKNLYDRLTDLNKKRNAIIHRAIFDFIGDMDKIEEQARVIMRTEIIQTLLNNLVDLYNIRKVHNGELEKQIKDKDLRKLA